MGNYGSYRKVTVDQDGNGVIRVTDSVVKRYLEGEARNHRQSTPAPAPEEPKDAPAPDHVEEQKPIPDQPTGRELLEASAPPMAEQKPEPRPDRPLGQFLEEARLAAIRMRQEKDAEIRAVEEQWRQRLTELNEAHVRNTKISEVEFMKAVSEVNEFLQRNTAKPMGEDLKAQVQKCYSENPKQVLRCSKEVREFTSFVQKQHVAKLVEGVS